MTLSIAFDLPNKLSRCFLCHLMLKNYEELAKHQETEHKDFFEFHEKGQKREPSPGDVTIF